MFDDLVAAKKYITLAHHVSGRMRLKINPKITKDPVKKKLEALSGNLPGVIDTRVNLMARSVVLRYDPEVISAEELETLVTTKDVDAARHIWSRYENTVMQKQ